LSPPEGARSPEDGSAFVRAARASDAAALARIQVESWHGELSGLVPDDVLQQLTSDQAVAEWESRWTEAIISPPTSRHRVFVAVARATGAGAARLGAVGFASAGPASDPDRWPATDGQLNELRVLPEHSTAGHASRLLHAVADTLAEDGFRTLSTWVLEADSHYREFLTAAGLEPDGARGELDMGKPLVVLRYATAIGGNGGERA
jgi:GNAT superfamily N-acetyltransferase